MKFWNLKHQEWQSGYCHIMEIVFHYNKHWYTEISVQHSRKWYTVNKKLFTSTNFITIMLIHIVFHLLTKNNVMSRWNPERIKKLTKLYIKWIKKHKFTETQIKYAIIKLQKHFFLPSVHHIWKVMVTSPKSVYKYCKLNQKLRLSFCT